MSKSPSLRRIQADIRELALDPSDRYYAHPLEHDMFEWHFTIRGADETDFEGGIYHGRILLPPEYPFKPPHIIFMTPSGRFETNKKICLSFSAYHPELWQPAWGIRLILEALISFMPTPADGAVGALDWSPDERKRLAKRSRDFCCPTCGKAEALLPKLDPNKKPKASRFSKEIEKLQQLQQMAERNRNEKKEESDDKTEADMDSKEAVEPKEPDVETSQAEEEEQKQASITSPEPSTVERPDLNANSGTSNSASLIQVETASDSESSPANEEEAERVRLLNQGDDGSRASHAAASGMIAGENPPGAQIRMDTNEPNDVFEESTLSWVYDPILNLMIVLLAAVSWLLWQKYVELQEELQILREQNLLLE